MELTIQTYLIVLPLVFLAAFVDSIGGGGGLISLPAYTLAGLPYGMASGCNKFSSTFGGISATLRYLKSGKILLKPALLAVIGALPGAWLGTKVSFLFGNEFMRVFMICAIPVIAAFLLLKKDHNREETQPLTKMREFFCFLTGLVTGFYDGFFGPGAGSFMILLFTWLAGMDMVSASATAKPVNLASNISSLITRLAAGQVIFALAIPAMLFSFAGASIGSKLALKKGAKLIRFVMLGVMALLIVKIVIDML